MPGASRGKPRQTLDSTKSFQRELESWHTCGKRLSWQLRYFAQTRFLAEKGGVIWGKIGKLFEFFEKSC
jgi:hypothetical protein